MLMDNVQSFVAPDAASSGLQWQIETAPVAYDRALAFMEARARTIRERGHDEMVWLLEHPPVYTAGTSAELKDLINPKFPVYHTGRGGRFTYHGPGQRIAYVMLDLQKRNPDLKKYVFDLEDWVIRACSNSTCWGNAAKAASVSGSICSPTENRKARKPKSPPSVCV